MTVVFKLGGSLLTLAGLSSRLQRVVNLRPLLSRLIVTGGGAAADIVRDWSHIHQLDEETAHWLAIASLDLNRAFINTQMNWQSAGTRNEACLHWRETRSPVQLNFDRFVRDEETKPGSPLPHNWDVTTDSIAAWTALRWPASELILLKSIPTPRGLTAQEAADRLLVDGYFPILAQQLKRISWCDLRDDDITIETWIESPAASPSCSSEHDSHRCV